MIVSNTRTLLHQAIIGWDLSGPAPSGPPWGGIRVVPVPSVRIIGRRRKEPLFDTETFTANAGGAVVFDLLKDCYFRRSPFELWSAALSAGPWRTPSGVWWGIFKGADGRRTVSTFGGGPAYRITTSTSSA